MEQIENKELFNEMFEELKESKQILIELLKKILKLQIKDIEFEGIQRFDTITEYEFSLFKINIIYSNQEKKDIYLKMIKGGKIKESIFCYWSLLYEEYLKENKDNAENVVQKSIITQTTNNETNSSLILTLNQKLNYCAEINLVELRNFVNNEKEYERWLDKLEIKDDDILFIGKKKY